MKTFRYNLVNSSWDPETLISTVTISTDVGRFTGSAKCHPEEENKSMFFGCQIAEGRAIIKYLEELLKINRAQYHTLKTLYTSVETMSCFNKDNYAASKIRRAKYEKSAEIGKRKQNIEEIERKIKILIKEREIVIKKMREAK